MPTTYTLRVLDANVPGQPCPVLPSSPSPPPTWVYSWGSGSSELLIVSKTLHILTALHFSERLSLFCPNSNPSFYSWLGGHLLCEVFPASSGGPRSWSQECIWLQVMGNYLPCTPNKGPKDVCMLTPGTLEYPWYHYLTWQKRPFAGLACGTADKATTHNVGIPYE